MKDAKTAIEADSWRQVSDPETGLAVYDYIRPDQTGGAPI
jgi:NTE family protein